MHHLKKVVHNLTSLHKSQAKDLPSGEKKSVADAQLTIAEQNKARRTSILIKGTKRQIGSRLEHESIDDFYDKLSEINYRTPREYETVTRLARRYGVVRPEVLVFLARNHRVNLSEEQISTLIEYFKSDMENTVERNALLRRHRKFVPFSNDAKHTRILMELYHMLHGTQYNEMRPVNPKILYLMKDAAIKQFRLKAMKNRQDGRYEVWFRLADFVKKYLGHTRQYRMRDYGKKMIEVCPTTVKRYVRALVNLLKKNKYYEAYRAHCIKGRPFAMRIRETMKSYAINLIRSCRRFGASVTKGIWGHNIFSFKSIEDNNIYMSPNQRSAETGRVNFSSTNEKMKYKNRCFAPPDTDNGTFCAC